MRECTPYLYRLPFQFSHHHLLRVMILGFRFGRSAGLGITLTILLRHFNRPTVAVRCDVSLMYASDTVLIPIPDTTKPFVEFSRNGGPVIYVRYCENDNKPPAPINAPDEMYRLSVKLALWPSLCCIAATHVAAPP